MQTVTPKEIQLTLALTLIAVFTLFITFLVLLLLLLWRYYKKMKGFNRQYGYLGGMKTPFTNNSTPVSSFGQRYDTISVDLDNYEHRIPYGKIHTTLQPIQFL
ncbi:hypothetical protein LOD99_15825 [Oopsacas minuta]|uniref:Uncharacterized protein n=1 Tax=Oopsacas minuta TaxID=111878 RepID=A0AAV7KA24_9METZ|nr:hypothetical protein LOD99_15825 [Oopsacas minuta]